MAATAGMGAKAESKWWSGGGEELFENIFVAVGT